VTRAVFDCVILLQASGRPTAPAEACLQAVRDGRLELFHLMGDDAFRQQFPGLSVIDPVTLLRELAMDHPKTELDRGFAEDEAHERNEAE
jgi:hypothetical protein